MFALLQQLSWCVCSFAKSVIHRDGQAASAPSITLAVQQNACTNWVSRQCS